MQQEYTEEDKALVQEITEKALPEYVNVNSEYYTRECKNISEIIESEMEMKPKNRIQKTEEICTAVNKILITLDTAEVHLVVTETSTKYNGEEGTTDTEYIFYYTKLKQKWLIENLSYNYGGGI